MSKSETEYSGVESHQELYVTPPASAATGPSEGNNGGASPDGVVVVVEEDEEEGEGMGGRKRRRSLRGSKPSLKRRTEVYLGLPKKRSKA